MTTIIDNSIPSSSSSIHLSPTDISILSLTDRLSELELSININTIPPVTTVQYPALPTAITTPEKPTDTRRSSLLQNTAPTIIPNKSIDTVIDSQPPVLTTVLSKYSELVSVWHRLESDPTLRQFFYSYNSMQSILTEKFNYSLQSQQRSIKESIILNSESQLKQQSAELQQLQSLLPILDQSWPINNQLESIELFQSNQLLLLSTYQSNTARLHLSIQSFITLYNDCIDLISRKFVNFNSQIKRIETNVDKLIKAKNQ